MAVNLMLKKLMQLIIVIFVGFVAIGMLCIALWMPTILGIILWPMAIFLLVVIFAAMLGNMIVEFVMRLLK